MHIPTVIKEYAKLEYLNKLIGKKIYDDRYLATHTGIQGCVAIQKMNKEQIFPEMIRYKTDKGEVGFPFFVIINLIEKGKAQDAFGYKYEIVE